MPLQANKPLTLNRQAVYFSLAKIALLLSFFCHSPTHAQAVTFKKYADLRYHTSHLIGGAKKRVWLLTEYLTDGDIAASLYIANYRKIDVGVLLGKRKIHHYLSRINYLKNHKIPVFLKPESLNSRFPTVLLIDEALYLFDSELDYRSRYQSFRVHRATPKQMAFYKQHFEKAFNMKVHVKSQRRVPVGINNFFRKPKYNPRKTPPGVDASGSFTYKKNYKKAPDGIPLKLPKELIFEKTPPVGNSTPSFANP